MSLLDRLKSAFGFQKPLTVTDGRAPFALTDAAKARIASFGPDVGIHIATRPFDDGHLVGIEEGEPLGPPPPQFDPLPITVSDPDLLRLRGLTLDWRDDRWAISLDLEVRARETPNPNGRLYLVSRLLSDGRSAFFTAADPRSPLAKRLLSVPGVASVLFREHTVTIERTADGPGWAAMDAEIDAALRHHFLLCGGPVTEDERPDLADPLADEVWAVLSQKVLPAIHHDGGDIELLGVDNGVVRLSMHGACRSCPSSTMTLKLGIEKALRDAFPGRIERVEQV